MSRAADTGSVKSLKLFKFFMLLVSCTLCGLLAFGQEAPSVFADAIINIENTTTGTSKDAPRVAYTNLLPSARSAFIKTPVYRFETRNTSALWKEIQASKTPLAVIEIEEDKTLKLYGLSKTVQRGFAVSVNQITPAQRKNYYHNGNIVPGSDGHFYFQMMTVLPNGKEIIAGYVSEQDILSPKSKSMLENSQTEAGVSNCLGGACSPSQVKDLKQLYERIKNLGTNTLFKEPGEFACPLNGQVIRTSRYGLRSDPFTGARKSHTGTDFAGSGQQPTLNSISSGRITGIRGVTWIGAVAHSGYVPYSNGYGYQIEITNDDGTVVTYNHLDRSPNCIKIKTINQRVKAGQAIGCMGSTGRSTGRHLHLEVKRNGVRIDPEKWQDFAKLCKGHYGVKRD